MSMNASCFVRLAMHRIHQSSVVLVLNLIFFQDVQIIREFFIAGFVPRLGGRNDRLIITFDLVTAGHLFSHLLSMTLT